MRGFGSIFAGMLALAAFVPAGAQSPFPSFQIAPLEPWRQVAVEDQASGSFAYCAMEADYEAGLTLGFARNNDGRTNIAIGFPDARLTVGQSYPVTLALDDGAARDYTAFSADPTILVIPTGLDGPFHDALAGATRLAVGGAQDEVVFALDRPGAALASLRRCVAGGGEEDEVLAAPTGPDLLPAPEPPPTALETILQAAGLGDARMVPLREGEDRPVDVAWMKGALFGGAKEVLSVAPDAFLDEMLAYIDRLEAVCPGAFNVEMGLPDEIGALQLARAQLGCLHRERETLAAVLFAHAGDTFTVFFLEAPSDTSALAIEARERIAEVVTAISETASDLQ